MDGRDWVLLLMGILLILGSAYILYAYLMGDLPDWKKRVGAFLQDALWRAKDAPGAIRRDWRASRVWKSIWWSWLVGWLVYDAIQLGVGGVEMDKPYGGFLVVGTALCTIAMLTWILMELSTLDRFGQDILKVAKQSLEDRGEMLQVLLQLQQDKIMLESKLLRHEERAAQLLKSLPK